MERKIKYDCFGFNEKSNLESPELKWEGCKILLEMICLERECPFYKTHKEYEEGLRR